MYELMFQSKHKITIFSILSIKMITERHKLFANVKDNKLMIKGSERNLTLLKKDRGWNQLCKLKNLHIKSKAKVN